MGKQILTTLVWSIMLVLIVASLWSLIGVNDWLMETLDETITVAIGFFFGYGQARRNKDRH